MDQEKERRSSSEEDDELPGEPVQPEDGLNVRFPGPPEFLDRSLLDPMNLQPGLNLRTVKSAQASGSSNSAQPNLFNVDIGIGGFGGGSIHQEKLESASQNFSPDLDSIFGVYPQKNKPVPEKTTRNVKAEKVFNPVKAEHDVDKLPAEPVQPVQPEDGLNERFPGPPEFLDWSLLNPMNLQPGLNLRTVKSAQASGSSNSAQPNLFNVDIGIGGFGGGSIHQEKLESASQNFSPDLDSIFGVYPQKNKPVPEKTTRNVKAEEVFNPVPSIPVSIKKNASRVNYYDDLFFGVPSMPTQFEEVDGESKERRSARLTHYQSTQARMAGAVADNECELRAQQEQEE